MRIARIWHKTESEGPGLRTAIWLQGCSIGCPGCINPHLWSFHGGDEVNVEHLADEILALDVDGITLLGGEPFDQAADCYLTNRYVDIDAKSLSNRIEMRVLPSGVIEVCGFASNKQLKEIAVSLSVKVKRVSRLG